MTATATITDLTPVTPNFREDMGAHYITIDITGWDDGERPVSKLSKKVLAFDGRHYTFIGWNSDSMKCYFRECANIAQVVKPRQRRK